MSHTTSMELFVQGHRVEIRKYPRKGGLIWRWWVFDGRDNARVDTGVVTGDREKALSAATASVERRMAGAGITSARASHGPRPL
jgi:hypothetical protein